MRGSARAVAVARSRAAEAAVVEEASAPSPAACRGAPSRSPCGTPMRRVGAAWPGEGPRGAGRVADEPR